MRAIIPYNITLGFILLDLYSSIEAIYIYQVWVSKDLKTI